MMKQAFLDRLNALTGALTEQERARLAEYYSEMIDDRMEEGIDEEEAVAALGDPMDIAREFVPAARQAEADAGSETVSALRGLQVKVANADVEIVRESLDNGAAAQLRFSDPKRFEWRMDGDTLSVQERRPEERHMGLEAGLRWLKQMISEPSLRVTVALSEGLADALDFEGSGGDIRLEGVRFAKARLVTASGDIELKSVACENGIGIDIRSHSGDVTLTDVRASNLMAHTASGDISGRGLDLSGRLRLESASGDVELRGLDCAEANVTTASGDIEIDRGRASGTSIQSASGDVRLDELETDPTLAVQTASGDVELTRCIARETRLATASGDVKLRLAPLSCGYDISANTRSGDVRLPRDNPSPAAGEIQPRIAVNTMSGDIDAGILG